MITKGNNVFILIPKANGNGYPRKGQNSKPKRQNRARERKDRKKSKRQSQKVKVNPGKWHWKKHQKPNSKTMEHEGKNPNFRLNKASPSSIFMYPEINIQRISLTGFPAQSVGSSNTDVLDLPCLLVLITGTSQSRQHVDTSLIHIESLASPPTAVQFDETLEGFHSSL
ncbi:hypothetical protein Tco_1334844 [Tanacetum coccineum]